MPKGESINPNSNEAKRKKVSADRLVRHPKFVEPGTEAMDKLVTEKSHIKQGVKGKNADMIVGRLQGEFNDQEQENYGTVDKLHDIDFIYKLIPALLEQRKDRNRKLRILVTGAGIGLFNDQLRSHFPDSVKVYGTSYKRPYDTARKKRYLRRASVESQITPAPGELPIISPEHQAELSKITDGSLNSDDYVTESIMEMHDFPEFDLIIDTAGEIYYVAEDLDEATQHDSLNIEQFKDRLWQHLVVGAKKLRSGGYLLLSSIYNSGADLLWEKAGELFDRYHVKVIFPGGDKETIISEIMDLNDQLELDKSIKREDLENSFIKTTQTLKQLLEEILPEYAGEQPADKLIPAQFVLLQRLTSGRYIMISKDAE